jgi:hypothetical protein
MTEKMPGNPYIRDAEYIDRAPEIRIIDAMMVVAFELRTANILAAQATPDWLNEARKRMGEQPFPPSLIEDFTTTAAQHPEGRSHECEAWEILVSDDGTRRYCAACGKDQ